jgi:hypothetical protein
MSLEISLKRLGEGTRKGPEVVVRVRDAEHPNLQGSFRFMRSSGAGALTELNHRVTQVASHSPCAQDRGPSPPSRGRVGARGPVRCNRGTNQQATTDHADVVSVEAIHPK